MNLFVFVRGCRYILSTNCCFQGKTWRFWEKWRFIMASCRRYVWYPQISQTKTSPKSNPSWRKNFFHMPISIFKIINQNVLLIAAAVMFSEVFAIYMYIYFVPYICSCIFNIEYSLQRDYLTSISVTKTIHPNGPQ